MLCGVKGYPGYYTDVYYYIANGWLCQNGLEEACQQPPGSDNDEEVNNEEEDTGVTVDDPEVY
jgi:hypothetical protein